MHNSIDRKLEQWLSSCGVVPTEGEETVAQREQRQNCEKQQFTNEAGAIDGLIGKKVYARLENWIDNIRELVVKYQKAIKFNTKMEFF